MSSQPIVITESTDYSSDRTTATTINLTATQNFYAIYGTVGGSDLSDIIKVTIPASGDWWAMTATSAYPTTSSWRVFIDDYNYYVSNDSLNYIQRGVQHYADGRTSVVPLALSPAKYDDLLIRGVTGQKEAYVLLIGTGTDVLGNYESFLNTQTVDSAGKTVITGNTGNNMISVASGNASIDGGSGVDTAIFSGSKSAYSITPNADGTYTTTGTTTGTTGTDTLANVERLIFSDGNLALDINGAAGEAYRVYQAAFDRTPDTSGLGYWISTMDKGASLDQVAGGFLSSAEFTSLYGSNPTTEQFITKLYNNVLHRAPELAGFNWWVNAVDTGAMTKAQALAGFAESAENKAALIGVISHGIEYTPYNGQEGR